MPEISLGTIINDRYKLDAEVGKGGMGTVYRAHDETLDREVAIKVLRKDAFGTEGQARLLNEAQTIAKLNHPNIVIVHDAGEYEDSPYIVMQFIEGKTLNEHKPADLYETIAIAKQICAALGHAHEHDIIHRDLKPENVIIDESGTVKIMDFGLARSVASRVSTEGYIVGTVFYMSPEQAMGDELDGRSDLYSLGVLLYELTTGEFPFEDNNPVAIISQHLHAPVIPPRAKNEDIPPGLNDLILQLLEKNRDDRPASAELVLEALQDPCLLDAEAKPEKELSVLDRIVRGRIVGRKAEIEEARAVWLKAMSSQGQTLLISGEPGIGKTRLMREVIAHAEISGGQTYVGECYAESNAPYSAFAQITRKAFQRHQNNSLELPNATISDLLKLVPDQAHLFPKVKPNPELDPESEQQRLLEHMVTFCDSLSQLAPLLFIVEDIHWADSSTLAMFQHLARRTKKMSVMLLSTYREVELKEARPFNNLLNELNRQRIGERIKLNRLTKSQTDEMLATIFQDETTPDFLEGVYRETDGNPFFIEEVCRSLVESGGVFYKDGAWDRFSMEELEIPQGIQVAVESRLTRMGETCQEVLRMAAVLGREFNVEVLKEALAMDEDALINALESAEGTQMIQAVDGKGDVMFAFVHALVPQAIRESIRVLRRRQMHKKVASAVEKLDPENYESLAHHHSQAGNDKEALKFHSLAGKRALKAFANQNAENHLLSALDLVEEDKPKADLLSQLGIAQTRLGKNKQAIETWGKAIAIYQELKDCDQAAYLYARSGRTFFDAGDLPGNLSICEEGLEVLKEAPASRGMAFLLGERARALFFNLKREEGLKASEKALKMAEKFGVVEVQVDMLNNLGGWGDNTIEEGRQMFSRAIELAEGANLWREAARVHNNFFIALSVVNCDFPNAYKHLQRAIELAHQAGSVDNEFFYLNNVDSFLGITCDFQEYEEVLERMGQLVEVMPDPEGSTRALETNKALLIYTRDRNLEQAIEKYRESLDYFRQMRNYQAITGAGAFLVFFLIQTEEYEEGEKILQEMIPLAEQSVNPVNLPSKCQLATILARMGKTKDARHAYEKAFKEHSEGKIISERFNQFLKEAEANLLVAEDKWEQAWEAFGQLHRSLAEVGDLPYQGFILTEWAKAHLLRGEEKDKQRAKELFGEAIKVCEEIGANGWVTYCKEEIEKIA